MFPPLWAKQMAEDRRAPPSWGNSHIVKSVLDSVEDNFRSTKSKALANLSVLLSSPTSIPSHTDFVDEVARLIREISSAEDGISVTKIVRSQLVS